MKISNSVRISSQQKLYYYDTSSKQMQEGSVIAIYFKWGHFTIPYFAPTQLLKYLITVHCSKSSIFVKKNQL